MRYITYFSLVAICITGILSACEDPIDVPSQFESPQLVVDAWVTNTSSTQTIVLNQTVDYFSGDQPEAVENATVELCNMTNSNCFSFVHDTDGKYIWMPNTGETFGSVGDIITLQIEVGDQTYTSTESINRTARLDSISIEFEEESIGFEEGLYAQAYAFDQPGRGDSYWMRTYKNDVLLNRPFEQVIAYDATFDAGADVDGTYFITPLRLGVNALDTSDSYVPYVPGDKIYVEVHSISDDAFDFLSIAIEQITNEGLFASPLANSKSNIFNSMTNDPILGIFNVAEVASLEKIVE